MRLAMKQGNPPDADTVELAYAAQHDLRTPIVAICQLVESIQEEYAAELPLEVTRRLLLIRDRADRFDSVLKRLTRFWRASDTSEAPQTIHLAALVGEIERELDVPPAAVIAADAASFAAPRRAFRLLLAELVDNAIRHGCREDIQVRVGATRRKDGWEISVSDNGAGIPARYRDRVWRPFSTLDSRPACAGLGLAIARRIAESHGGRAWIDEAPGGGARVVLFWPT
jgi:signal transduction histidine kinase